MNIIFYGPEGSGKTTQGRLLAKKLKVPHLVSGNLVREAIANDQGWIGDVCRKKLRMGHYVPDTEMFVLWKRKLKKDDVQKGWVMDGFPRNVKQAKFLHDKLRKYGQKVNAVVFLKLSQKESIKRLLARGRKLENGELHDSPERIRERLKRYYEAEADVLDFYKKTKTLLIIDAGQTIEKIHREILKKLKK